MTASRRLYTQLAESAAEAASSRSRPLNAKEIIGVGSALVLISHWASGVQLGAFKESLLAEIREELGAVKMELGAVRVELGAVRVELGAVKVELGAMKTELGAMRKRWW